MSSFKKPWIYVLCLSIICLLSTVAAGAEEDAAEPLLPEGLVMKEDFKPGIGLPVGKVLLVQGEVVTIHENESTGYYTRRNQPIFKGDKIVALEKGRVRIKLNDGSIITLASATKIVINKSVYNPDKKSRSSFIGMDKGKARFLIKKLADYKNDEFNVKTKTAVAGVRGSEFIIRATELLTEIITLKDTRLEVFGLAKPGVKTIVLKDFEKTVVALGELPAEVEMVTPIEVKQFNIEFSFTPDISTEGGIDIEPGKKNGKGRKKQGNQKQPNNLFQISPRKHPKRHPRKHPKRRPRTHPKQRLRTHPKRRLRTYPKRRLRKWTNPNWKKYSFPRIKF